MVERQEWKIGQGQTFPCQTETERKVALISPLTSSAAGISCPLQYEGSRMSLPRSNADGEPFCRMTLDLL